MKKSITVTIVSLMLLSVSGCTDTAETALNNDQMQIRSEAEETTEGSTEGSSEETAEESTEKENKKDSDKEDKKDKEDKEDKEKKTASDVKYDLGKYKDKGISVKYPIISEETIEDEKIRNRTNTLIEDDATVFIDKFGLNSEDNTDTDIVPISICESDNILSVVYEGDCYIGDSKEPKKIRFASNIDMNRGTRCSLADLYETEKIAEILADTDDFEVLCDDEKIAKEMKRYIQSYSANRLDDFLYAADFYTENKKTIYPDTFSSYAKDGYIDITFIFDDPELKLGDYGVFRIKISDIETDTKNKK